MNKDIPPEEMNKAVFTGLVVMLGSSAMQQLGKVINRTTGKAEVDLEGAQATIDILVMLQAKTRGNLDKDEERLLTDTLTSLQLNYVETAQSQPPQAGEEPKEAAPAAEGAQAAPSTPEQDGDRRRYHKTYGEP